MSAFMFRCYVTTTKLSSVAADYCQTVKSVINCSSSTLPTPPISWRNSAQTVRMLMKTAVRGAHGDDKHLAAENDLYAHPGK